MDHGRIVEDGRHDELLRRVTARTRGCTRDRHRGRAGRRRHPPSRTARTGAARACPRGDDSNGRPSATAPRGAFSLDSTHTPELKNRRKPNVSSASAPEFGPNDWFVEEKYQQFLADPESVDPIWRDFFADNAATAGLEKPANGAAARRDPDRGPPAPRGPPESGDASPTVRPATPTTGNGATRPGDGPAPAARHRARSPPQAASTPAAGHDRSTDGHVRRHRRREARGGTGSDRHPVDPAGPRRRQGDRRHPGPTEGAARHDRHPGRHASPPRRPRRRSSRRTARARR